MVKWSPQNVTKLKTLCAKGLKPKEIADHFEPGTTANAIIGKIHRLKLKRTDPLIPGIKKPSPSTTTTPEKKKHVMKARPELPQSQTPVAKKNTEKKIKPLLFDGKPRTLLTVGYNECRTILESSDPSISFADSPMCGRGAINKHGTRCVLCTNKHVTEYKVGARKTKFALL